MFEIKKLEQNQVELLDEMIKEMATFENLVDQLQNNKEKLNRYIFLENLAKACLLYEDDKVIGYLMYFYAYSSFTGSPTLYVEDIYIREAYRHKGYGTKCFNHLAKVAIKNECKRMDFVCLDWNKNAQNFYHKLGANAHNEWLLERIEENELKKLAGNL